MGHMIDQEVPQPFMCEDCKHYLGGFRCKAFDNLVAAENAPIGEEHTKIVPGQKGDYVFETDKPRQYIRAYFEDNED